MPNPRHLLLTRNGTLEPGQVLAEIADEIAGSQAGLPLLLWSHGGLTDPGRATSGSDALLPHLDRCYPLFVTWDSGIPHAIPDAVAAWVKRNHAQLALSLIERLIKVKQAFFGLAAADIPEQDMVLTDVDRDLISQALDASPEFQTEAFELEQRASGATALAGVSSADAALDQKLRDRMASSPGASALGFRPGAKAALKEVVFETAEMTLARIRNGTARNTLHETIIECGVRVTEIVADVWDSNKNDAEAHFAPDGALTALFEVMRSRGTLQGRELILGGHSAGVILVREALKNLNLLPDIPVHVRLFGAADTSAKFLPALNGARDRVKSFRSFGLKQDLEEAEPLLAVLPSIGPAIRDLYHGTILCVVSFCLEKEIEEPIVGMQRPVNRIARLSSAARACVSGLEALGSSFNSDAWIWTPTDADAPARLSSESRTHVGFLEPPAVLAAAVQG